MLPDEHNLSAGSSSSIARAMHRLIAIFFVGFIIIGCNLSNSLPTPQPAAQNTIPPLVVQTSTSTSLPTSVPLPTLTSAPTQPPRRIWLPSYLPSLLVAQLTLPAGYILAPGPSNVDITLDVAKPAEQPVSQWIYALVAPFPTIPDGVTADELQQAWQGELTENFNESPLLMDANTLGVLAAFWGDPGPQAVKVLAADELIDFAWANRPSWAVVPFEALDPRWKVLTIDGQSPVRKEFDPSNYPLTIPFVLSGNVNLDARSINLPSSNRQASLLTTVAMTGVTAMVRATAFAMERDGITYPAQEIGSILADADITHVSNEIPFTPDCPFPDPIMEDLVFCSSPKYIELLKAIGTDIVELTGDHFMDYGADATLYTLQMYKDLGWKYFGGGANALEARQPVLIENNGNRLAFMGCNIGCQVKTEIPCDAIASEDHPGAAECDFNWISSEIPKLTDQGYQVIFTFQHREYYTYTAEAILVTDFGQVAQAGAAIVSGSQAHQPHGFAFEDGRLIHYGLGNLFFDQYHFCGYYACDDAFIDRHVFYAGRYISTELITIHFVDWAQPRLMTPEERVGILQIIFDASGW